MLRGKMLKQTTRLSTYTHIQIHNTISHNSDTLYKEITQIHTGYTHTVTKIHNNIETNI